MSIDFAPFGTIPFDALFDGRLAKRGIREAVGENTRPGVRYLHDGTHGGIWVYADEDGASVCAFTSYMGSGNPGNVLGVIAREFGVEIGIIDPNDGKLRRITE